MVLQELDSSESDAREQDESGEHDGADLCACNGNGDVHEINLYDCCTAYNTHDIELQSSKINSFVPNCALIPRKDAPETFFRCEWVVIGVVVTYDRFLGTIISTMVVLFAHDTLECDRTRSHRPYEPLIIEYHNRGREIQPQPRQVYEMTTRTVVQGFLRGRLIAPLGRDQRPSQHQ